MTLAERRARLGQTGAVVRVFAETIDAARAKSFAIERALFDRGGVATVIDGGRAPLEAAEACARAGVVAIVAVERVGAVDFEIEVDGAPAEDAVVALDQLGIFGPA